MQWLVQTEAVFKHVYEERMEQLVEDYLAGAGALVPGSESVQGDPGPRLWTSTLIEADSQEAARERATTLVRDALSVAGVTPGEFVLECSAVRPYPLRPPYLTEPGWAPVSVERDGVFTRTKWIRRPAEPPT